MHACCREFGFHGAAGAAGKKLRFRALVETFLEDLPALKLVFPVLQKAAS